MSILFEPAISVPKRLADPIYIGVSEDYKLWVDKRLLSFSAEELLKINMADFLSCPSDALDKGDLSGGHYLGSLGGRDCLALSVTSDRALPDDYQVAHPYQLLLILDEGLFALIGRALQIMQWDNNHQFCGACGKPTTNHSSSGDRMRRCTACNLSVYPRISPCVIVLVTKGEELLLANGVGHPENMYSTLAGFVESGESVEDCLHREVTEEVGLSVHQLQYHGSQPWPFPHQLMLGFFAEHLDGDITPNESEINDARWWHYKELPEFLPGPYSIAGQLIETALKRWN